MKKRARLLVGTRTAVIAIMAATAHSLTGPSVADPGENSLVSLEAASQRAAGQGMGGVSLSGTGRYVAFDSAEWSMNKE